MNLTGWIIGMLFGTVSLSAQEAAKVYRAPERYVDGRSQAVLRMDARDEGLVLPCGTGPDSCDTYGAREAVVIEYQGVYYLHYDGAGKDGWLSCLATSRDLRHWTKQGLQLTLGQEGQPDSKSASSPWLFFADGKWHMFYVGTQFCSPAPDRVPSVPYVTLKAEADHPAGPWRKRYDVVPFVNEAGTYYSDTASPGDVVEQDGEYLMFFGAAAYTAPHKLGRTVGIARTRDLDGEWQVDPQPIFPATEQCENTSLYYEPSNETWFLFTNHIGIHPDRGEYTDAVWVYWTKDLNHWNTEDKAIVIDCQNTRQVKGAIGMPSVIRVGDSLAILYDGAPGENYSHMGRGINLAWLSLPLTPPVK